MQWKVHAVEANPINFDHVVVWIVNKLTFPLYFLDFETIEKDNSITIRNRDNMEQIRISTDNLLKGINDQLESIKNSYI